jgi:RNA polymerase sigma-70 factor, ECF subfamily
MMAKIGRSRARADPASLSDEQLMQFVGEGDARAFEAVFDRHADVAWSLAYRICGRRTLADEVVHDTFLLLWRGAVPHDRARASARSWILTAVHDQAVATLRRGDVGDGAHSRQPTASRPDGEQTAEISGSRALAQPGAPAPRLAAGPR